MSKRVTTDDANPIYSLKPLHLVNISLEYTVSRNDSELKIYTRLNNIFNNKYQIVRSYATPGINWIAGISLNLVKLRSDE